MWEFIGSLFDPPMSFVLWEKWWLSGLFTGFVAAIQLLIGAAIKTWG